MSFAILLRRSTGTMIPLNSYGEVDAYLQDAFKRHTKGAIIQSYFAARTLSGLKDYCRLIEPEGQIDVERYFIITKPAQISFAAHSLSHKDYWRGVMIHPSFWRDSGSSIFEEITCNITIFPRQVVFTFGSPAVLDGQKASEPMSSDSRQILGLAVKSPSAPPLMRDYIGRLFREQKHKIELDDVKKYFFAQSWPQYLLAICNSIAKDVSAHDSLHRGNGHDGLGYIGIVGSFVQVLQEANRDSRESKDVPPKEPVEIDLLIFISKEAKTWIAEIYKHAEAVADAYSIPGTLSVAINREMAPVHIRRDEANVRHCQIQLIINEKLHTEAKRGSQLVMSSRLARHHGLANRHALPSHYKVQDSLTARHLLDELLGLVDLRNQIDEEAVRVTLWDLEKGKKVDRMRSLNGEQLVEFCRYAVKWASYNYLRIIEDMDLLGRPVEELLSQVSAKIHLDTQLQERLLAGEKDAVRSFLTALIERVIGQQG